MYDKWMSKGALFRKDQMKTSNTCQLPSQQNTNRAKETDERDLMQQVVNIVQDCNKEVKNTLKAVKEKLESQSEFHEDKLSDTMKAFLEDVWKHEERMLQAIEEGKQVKERSCELEKQLAAKDTAIKQLQSQLEEKDKTEDVKRVAKAVRQEMLSPQLAVENKLMEILEVTREASEQHSEQLNQYQNQITAQAKHYKEWKTANQKLFKEMEKRLQKDISSLRKDLQKDEEEWRSSVQDQLVEACSSHSQDMERLIERAITDCSTTSCKQGMTSAAATSAIVTAVKKDLQAVLQKQTKSMEKNLQVLWQQQMHKQQQQLHNLHQTLMAVVTESMQSVAEQVQERSRDDGQTPLTMPAFEEKIEEYHADIRKQLEEMHKHHVEEVKRLQKDSQLSDHGLASSTAHRPFTDAFTLPAHSMASSQSGFPKTTGYPLQRRQGTGRLSPLSDLDKASLFSKTKPSPVVAVFPQQQSVKATSGLTEKNGPVNSDTEVTFQQQPSQSTDVGTRAVTSKKRKGRSRKKCAVKKRKAQREVQVIQNQNSSSQPEELTAAKPLTVYDFPDEQSPDQGRQSFRNFQLQNSENQRNELCSPSASTESYLSSPAVSVTVDTEVVWIRRSRWQTSSTPKQIYNADQKEMDMLSSPFMSTITQRPLRQLEVKEDHTKFSRTRSGMKRLR